MPRTNPAECHKGAPMKGGKLKIGWHGEEQGDSLGQLSSLFVRSKGIICKSKIIKRPDTKPFWLGENINVAILDVERQIHSR